MRVAGKGRWIGKLENYAACMSWAKILRTFGRLKFWVQLASWPSFFSGVAGWPAVWIFRSGHILVLGSFQFLRRAVKRESRHTPGFGVSQNPEEHLNISIFQKSKI